MMETTTFSSYKQQKRPAAHHKDHCLIVSIGTLEANTILLLVLVLAGAIFQFLLPVPYTLIFWSTVPTVLYPLWWHRSWKMWDTFLWIKIVSLMPVATLFATVSRCCPDGLLITSPATIQWGCFLILAVNMLEAAAADILLQRAWSSWSPINAVAAVLLVLAMTPSVGTIRSVATANNNNRDILWSLGGLWVLAYTVWNFMFVYNNYPWACGRHTAVLLAPLLLCHFQQDGLSYDTWAQSRCYTLAFYFLLRNTCYERLRAWTDLDLGNDSSNNNNNNNDKLHPHRTSEILAFSGIVLLLGCSRRLPYIIR